MGPFGPALALACRVVLAAILAFAAVAKIADGRALPGRLRAMGVMPRWFSVWIAFVLPVVELAVAATLVFAPGSAFPGIVALALLVAFSAFLLGTVRRRVPCACFGSVRPGRVDSTPDAIMRNGLLAALSVLAIGSAHGARAGGTIAIGALVAAVAVRSVTRVT
jgi:hypothetical protein